MRLVSELWKSIGIVNGIDFTGIYEISTKGRVKRLERTATDKHGNKYYVPFAIRYGVPMSKREGYLRIILRKNGEYTTAYVHKLVAEAFLINPNGYEVVNHKDEDKQNPDVNNLEWCTRSYNVLYSRTPEIVAKISKPVAQIDMDGNIVKIWPSMKSTSEGGFIYQDVQMCVNGKLKKHKGFIWKSVNDIDKSG